MSSWQSLLYASLIGRVDILIISYTVSYNYTQPFASIWSILLQRSLVCFAYSCLSCISLVLTCMHWVWVVCRIINRSTWQSLLYASLKCDSLGQFCGHFNILLELQLHTQQSWSTVSHKPQSLLPFEKHPTSVPIYHGSVWMEIEQFAELYILLQTQKFSFLKIDLFLPLQSKASII